MSESTAGFHRCPGGCGDLVKNELFACKKDWFILPADIRRQIWDTAGRSILDEDRSEAVTAAAEYYLALENGADEEELEKVGVHPTKPIGRPKRQRPGRSSVRNKNRG